MVVCHFVIALHQTGDLSRVCSGSNFSIICAQYLTFSFASFFLNDHKIQFPYNEREFFLF